MYWRHSGNPNHFQDFIDRGFCPVCEIKLESTYHTDCTFINTPEWLQFKQSKRQ